MDYDYLLALQNLRYSLGQGIEIVFVTYSEAALYVGLVLCAIIYWCISKRTGQFALLCFSVGNWINQLVKNIACVYRPWIVDSRIMPAPASLPGATGYSFPSGHTVTAGVTFGAVAWSVRKKLPIVAIVLVVLVLIEAFSRNYLGVHTPQDVLVGLLEAAVVVILGSYLYSRYEAYCERTKSETPSKGSRSDAIVVLVVLALCIAGLVFVEVKAYPMDYVEGALQVDPELMKRDCFEGVGVMAGMFLGWYCERRWVNFGIGSDVRLAERIVRGVVGLVIVGALFYGFDIVVKAVLDPNMAKLTSRLVLSFTAMFLVPLTFKPLHRVFAKENVAEPA
ncbi:MAG: phosphatase PAP2 family protein [Eggerthellaceae bacterium]|nr:phosphatase PAP2 family protein [Eggerthellaceae bacterium]